MYLISSMFEQVCRAEAKLAAPVAVRLATQNLRRTMRKSVVLLKVNSNSATHLQ